MIKHQVSGFPLPIQILDKKHSVQNTVATASLWLDLPIEDEYPNSELLVSLLQSYHGQMTIDQTPEVLSQLARRFNALALGLLLNFPYFIDTDTKYGIRPLAQDVSFSILLNKKNETDFVLKVTIPAQLNQHPLSICVSLKSTVFYWIEDIVNVCKQTINQANADGLSMNDFCPLLFDAFQDLKNIEWITISIKHNEATYYQCEKSWTWPQKNLNQAVSPPPSKIPSFGAWLKQQRQQRNLSQQKLAEILGCSNSFLSRVEACDKPPSIAMLKSLAALWSIEEDRILLLARIVPESLAEQMANNIDFFLNWMHREKQSEEKITLAKQGWKEAMIP